MIAHRIPARTRDLGGLSVGRVLPAPARRLVGPFVFFDHMGPADFAPGSGVDVRPHPHIGLATVTYLFEGALGHRDSLGIDIVIRPRAVNLMTAGRGVAHSERTPPPERANGHRLHGIQAWLALPDDQAEAEPSFAHHPADTLPAVDRGGARHTLIAGRAFDAEAPVAVASPMFYADVEAGAGAVVDLPDDHEERALYVVEGAVEIAGERAEAREMLVFEPGVPVRFTTPGPARVMLLGGAPVGDRHIWWNFVSTSPERIHRAAEDWRAGRFAPVPGETEFIPLPDDPLPRIGAGGPTT